MTAAPRGDRTRSSAKQTLVVEDLVDYCSRPRCREEFRRTVAPGRRQEYCSDVCRRTAEKEFRQAKSRLAHFEQLVATFQLDVAAFGRPDDREGGDEDRPLRAHDSQQTAERALHRAGGVLAVADQDDKLVQELRALYVAVSSVILSDRMAG